jgi:hypothetical protein
MKRILKNKYFISILAFIVSMALVVYGVGHRYYCFENDARIICVWKSAVNG